MFPSTLKVELTAVCIPHCTWTVWLINWVNVPSTLQRGPTAVCIPHCTWIAWLHKTHGTLVQIELMLPSTLKMEPTAVCMHIPHLDCLPEYHITLVRRKQLCYTHTYTLTISVSAYHVPRVVSSYIPWVQFMFSLGPKPEGIHEANFNAWWHQTFAGSLRTVLGGDPSHC